MTDFTIKFLKRENKTQIGWVWGSRKSFLYADTVNEEVRDRRIVSILRKYLDMEFESAQLSVFNRKDFETLGELLFDLIFNAENIQIEFNEWYNSALRDEEQASAYNIFLEFEQDKEFDDLAILPWEYIHFKPRDAGLILDEPFLAASTSKKINFYRKVPFTFLDAQEEDLFKITPPLKILLLISDPKPAKELTKKEELFQYFRSLKDNYSDDLLQIKYIYQPSSKTDKFKTELNTGPSDTYSLENELGEKIGQHDASFSPDIIHFVGHGFVEDNNGMLIFTEEDKRTAGIFNHESMSDVRFANCIKDSRLHPKLVFLQVCNGGRIVDYMNKSGTAIRLLEKRVPFVIAMQNPIQEDHALRFTQSFYNNFMKGKNIGTCVSAGRYELGGQGEFNQKAFGSPVLFTYVNFPLTLKTQEEKKTKEADSKEEIIKYCNHPGCPHYGDELRYSATDKYCSQGHDLVTKKKGSPAEMEAARTSRSAVANPNVSRGIKSIDSDSTRNQNNYTGGLTSSNDIKNGNKLRQSTHWSSSLFKIKGEIHSKIAGDAENVFQLLKLYIISEFYLLKLKEIENSYTHARNSGNLHEKEKEIKDALHQLTDELKEDDIKPEYLLRQ